MWMAWVAAILYSSWPFAYILNPIAEHHDLASILESPHQPYGWFFISMDILAGAVMVYIGYLQFKRPNVSKLVRLSVGCYIAFGLMVVVSALLPINCDPSIQSCGPLVNDPVLIVHGLLSILSVVFLFMSILLTTITIIGYKLPNIFRWAAYSIIISWVVFGMGSAVAFVIRAKGNFLQYYFITICSISFLLLVGFIEYFYLLHEAGELDS
jgi:hypothetical protein